MGRGKGMVLWRGCHVRGHLRGDVYSRIRREHEMSPERRVRKDRGLCASASAPRTLRGDGNVSGVCKVGSDAHSGHDAVISNVIGKLKQKLCEPFTISF